MLNYQMIVELIARKHEGDYWDYKAQHHECKAELLHDIICFANALVHGSRYIILGVKDNGHIVGVENDSKRRKQADIIDCLRSKKFAGDIRPEVGLHTFTIENHEIDVIEIYDGNYTPYYLKEDYADQKDSKHIVVRANYVYSRTGDTNTPINTSADLYVVEKLWRKRFGIDTSPFQRLSILLDNLSDWNLDLGNRDYSFCISSPEYRIEMTELEDCFEPCSLFYLDDTPCMGDLRIMYYSTPIYESKYWGFDGARIIVPHFKSHYIVDSGINRFFYCYIKKSIEGQLLRLFTDGTYNLTTRSPEHCFILFEDQDEYDRFVEFAGQNFDLVRDIPLSSACKLAIECESKKGQIGIKVEDVWRIKRLYQKWKDSSEM